MRYVLRAAEPSLRFTHIARTSSPMTEPNFDQATIPASARPSRQRASQFKGMYVLETDGPLLAKLSPKKQAVLRTTGSYEDRARQLGVPVGTRRSRFHRARAKLVALRTHEARPIDTL